MPALLTKIFPACAWLGIALLLAGPPAARADKLDDFIEGAGTVGKFGIDVLQDLGPDGMSSEESGKERLKGLMKDKAMSFLKDKVTGGDDISLGMGLILERIHDAVGAKKRDKGGYEGICQTAALNKAWGITFDAKNARVLRGAANTWFDLMTSTLPGASGFANKLLTETGKTAGQIVAREIYDKTRGKIEDEIKKAWAAQKPETFKYTRTDGPCSLTLTVLWNKAKGAYLFVINGKCNCKKVKAGGRTIPMRQFSIIGGASIKPELDTRDPARPKMRFSVGRPRVKMLADCNCAGGGGSWVEPPKKKDPVTLPEQGLIESEVLQPKCDACWPKLRVVQKYVGDINDIAIEMNRLRKSIEAEEYKTAARDAEVARWETLAKQLEATQKQHDRAFQIFVDCEKEACKRGTDPFRLQLFDTEPEKSSYCDKCADKVAEVNAIVAKVNAAAKALNAVALVTQRSEVRHGTVLGNKTWDDWHALKPGYDKLKGELAAAKKALSICEVQRCSMDRFKAFDKERPRSGACQRCRALQQQYNDMVAKYNAAVDKFNAYQLEAKPFVLEHGDDSVEAINGIEALKKKHGFRQALGEISDFNDKAPNVLFELDQCIRKWCRGKTAEDEKEILIGGGTGRDGGGERKGRVVQLTSNIAPLDLPALPRAISTRCTKCSAIVRTYNDTIQKIEKLQESMRTAHDALRSADFTFQYLAAVVNAYRLPRTSYEGAGDKAVTVRNVDVPLFTSGSGGDVLMGPGHKAYKGEAGAKDLARDFTGAVAARDQAQEALLRARQNLVDLRFKHDAAWKSLTGLVINLVRCERSCATVSIRDVRIVTGNNPYDRIDPVAEDSVNRGGESTTMSNTTTTTTRPRAVATPAGGGSSGAPSAPEPTIQVVNNIPVSRLFLAGPDACASNHYHGDANNCNGVFTVDPAPGVCGHGTVSDVTTIPVSACPDL